MYGKSETIKLASGSAANTHLKNHAAAALVGVVIVVIVGRSCRKRRLYLDTLQYIVMFVRAVSRVLHRISNVIMRVRVCARAHACYGESYALYSLPLSALRQF